MMNVSSRLPCNWYLRGYLRGLWDISGSMNSALQKNVKDIFPSYYMCLQLSTYFWTSIFHVVNKVVRGWIDAFTAAISEMSIQKDPRIFLDFTGKAKSLSGNASLALNPFTQITLPVDWDDFFYTLQGWRWNDIKGKSKGSRALRRNTSEINFSSG